MTEQRSMSPQAPAEPLRRLLEISSSISGVLDQDELFSLVIRSAVEVTGAERGYLFLLDPDESLSLEERLQIGASFRLDPHELETAEFRASRSAIMKTVAERTGQTWNDGPAQPSPSQSVELMGLRSILCEPLLAHNQLVGLIYLDSKITARYHDGHQDLLRSFAAQAAVAVENARLVHEREEALRREHAEQVKVRELAAYGQAMASFLSIASHDLKGPLTILQTGLRLLQRNPEVDDLILKDMDLAVGRARRLVAMYLDANALHLDGDIQLEKEKVKLLPLIQRELEMVTKTLPPRRLEQFEFRVELTEETSLVVDEDRLSQVFYNLLDNAVKYSPKGGVVAVVAKHLDDEIEIRVSDQGRGLDEEGCQRLFDRYVRIDSDRDVRGSGLGLWIVRRLVESHGGSIRVQSRPSEGTTFILTFPA